MGDIRVLGVFLLFLLANSNASADYLEASRVADTNNHQMETAISTPSTVSSGLVREHARSDASDSSFQSDLSRSSNSTQFETSSNGYPSYFSSHPVVESTEDSVELFTSSSELDLSSARDDSGGSELVGRRPAMLAFIVSGLSTLPSHSNGVDPNMPTPRRTRRRRTGAFLYRARSISTDSEAEIDELIN